MEWFTNIKPALDVLSSHGIDPDGNSDKAIAGPDVGSISSEVYPTTLRHVLGDAYAYPTDDNDEGLDWWERHADDRLRDWWAQLSKNSDNGYRSSSNDSDAEREGLEPFCAWYQPIHWYGYRWGIFIREQCLLNKALRIAMFAKLPFTKATKTPSKEIAIQLLGLLRATFYSTFLHEQFHHKVESFGFRLLVMTGANRYAAYKENVYRPTFKTAECLEESLANAESYLRFNDSRYIRRVNVKLRKAVRAYLPFSFKNQPPGYREGGSYLTVETFAQGLRKLRSQIRDGTLAITEPESHWLVATDTFRSLMAIDQRIFMVRQPGSQGLFDIHW